jgi:antitoxin HigA-1
MNRQPTHPGAILREDVIPALKEQGISIAQFARDLHISRNLLYGILSERSPVTSNIAVRLGKVLGNGADIWLRMQQAHDLWEAENELIGVLDEMPVYQVA